MNTSVRNLTVGGRSIPLDPPRPPEKPHMLLWIDTETTGISRTDAKILEPRYALEKPAGIGDNRRES